ncbi:hypothetical protein L486_07976 [Kwoniella mangroviensis CBS 10435]|uniref:PFU domain-containing protein n=1 Tax=Kwoniella mangroviensis CBS 10435 TaxID=1331196 RepID=A0A1B9IFG8_9TREE|nr:hypothetical protein L486_07976 [Kwoniella mangroviensis CBS 10435]
MTPPHSTSDQYELSCILAPPHQSDVKAVLAISDDMIASASRDQSVGIWTRSGKTKFELKALLGGHHAYVNSLAHIPSSNDRDAEDFVASGGNSSLILLHSLKTFSPESEHCLIGHSLNVCTMSYSTKRKKLISGSWDQTARIWSRSLESREWVCERVLEGHEQAVWGVTIIDEGPKANCYLTADRLIHLWNEEGQILQRFKGSPEPVRSLAILPGGETFASACNDNLVRMWNFDGIVLERLKGHKDYVYQVVPGKMSVELVSCGEDHAARTWSITGGSDGGIRIWSKEKDRIAEQDVREAYMNLVKASLPGAEENSKSPDPPDQPSLTIDIDLSDDDPPVPLVFEIGSDPRSTAEAFGQEHGLSENYINQIEAFIKAHLDALGSQ